MKRKSYWLSLLALLMIVTLSVQPALAYFTSNTSATGSATLNLGYTTEITEDVKDLVKTVTIQNTKGNPVWVRAIAYCGETFELTVSGWGSTVGRNEWVYYGEPIAEGEATAALTVAVTGIPEDSEFPVKSFNVSVQYECIPVETYDADGNPVAPLAADWENSELVIVGTSTP